MNEPKKTLESFLAAVPDAPSSAPEFHGGTAATPPKDPTPTETVETAETAQTPGSKSSPEPTPAESASGTTTETAQAGGSKSPDVEAIKRALREGDLETIGELLEEDPAGFDERTPKWAARNRREAKLKAENAAVLEKAERIVQRFSTVDTLLGRIEKGDFSALPELVEHVGQDWDSAAMKAFRSRRGADPRVPELEARVAKAEAQAVEGRTAAARAADRLFFETLRDEVDTGHLVRKVDGWEQRVAEVLRESVDETGDPRLSVKQAADRVVRREREEYERRRAVFAEPAPTRARAATPERAAGATGTTKRRLTRDEWLSTRK